MADYIFLGIMTCSGVGILTVASPAVAFAWGTFAPLAERFRDLNKLFPPFWFGTADG